MGRRSRARYVLWKGDQCVGIGTAPELAERIGCNPRTIRWYANPSAKKRDKGNRLVAERI